MDTTKAGAAVLADDATEGQVPESPSRPKVYDHLAPLVGRRFQNRLTGITRRLTFVGVAERDRVVVRGHKPRHGRGKGGMARVREVRVQLDEKIDLGAETFVRGWDLVED